MKSKAFLEQWKDGGQAIESLERQVISLDAGLGQLTSAPLDREYTTGSRDRSNANDVKVLLQREDCSHRLSELRRRYSQYQDQVLDAFRKMPDNKIKETLIRYYCGNETQKQIGESYGYDARQIRRYLSYGYQSFPVPADPVDLGL